MKKILLFIISIAFSHSLMAQETYTVNNESLALKNEVNGTLDLLWNIINNEYRYFIKDANDTITELKNTKDTNKKFQNEYQQQLRELTNLDASKVKLTLYSLKNFINNYNASQDKAYVVSDEKAVINSRIAIFGGVSNYRFLTNPDDIKTGTFGAEFEVYGKKIMTRHSGFASLKYTLSSDDFDYTETQIALGYRFRFINKECYNLYAQTKFATFTYSESKFIEVSDTDPNTFITDESSGSAFDTPFILGLGADFQVGNGYISFVYDSIFALLMDNPDNFPIDFSIGYKFNL